MAAMNMLRRHWMAIPLGVAAPLMLATVVIGKASDWSPGTVGGIVTLIMMVAVAVGTLVVPREP